MIDDEEYNQILEQGLILDHWMVLCNIKNGVKQVKNRRIQGFINLLTKKDYIKDDALTEKGEALVKDCELITQVAIEANLPIWTTELHGRLQEKLKELTGRTQVVARIESKAYSFLPNAVDLAKVLQRAITAYKLKDKEKIENALFKYINDCNISKKWYPLLNYYIMKDGMSRMVTDIESGDETQETEFKSAQKFI